MLSSDEDESGNQGGVTILGHPLVDRPGAPIQGNDAGNQGDVAWNPIRQPFQPPALTTVQQLQGFSRFVRDHISPTHKRVTAGGRVVPAGPVTPPVTFSKPFLDEFIQVADRFLQGPQEAQVDEPSSNSSKNNLTNVQQVHPTCGSNTETPAYVHHRVKGNPSGRKPPRVLQENASTPEAQANTRPTALLPLPGSEILSVQHDGSHVVTHHGLTYLGTLMEDGKTRYDLMFYADGQATAGYGPGYILEALPAPAFPVGNTSSAAGGQTQTQHPDIALPYGSQLQAILPNGTYIFLFDGMLKSAKLVNGKKVYGEVIQDGIPVAGVDFTHGQACYPMQVARPMPAPGLVPSQHSYLPAAGLDAGLAQFQSLAPDKANMVDHAAYQSELQRLNTQLGNIRSELAAVDRDWALNGDEREPFRQGLYSQKRGFLVNAIATLRQAVKKTEFVYAAKLASVYGGPSNSGLADRTNQPRAKKQLSPAAPPFVPGSYGFAGTSIAGPSTALVTHGDPSSHLRNDSVATWNTDMEHTIMPSIGSVIGTVLSRKGKEKATEYFGQETQAPAPVSVSHDLIQPEGSENQFDTGSEVSFTAKDEQHSHVPLDSSVQSHFHDSDPIAKYPHEDSNGKSWLKIHFDETTEGATARAEYEAERIAKYRARRGIIEEVLLQHISGEKRMAVWEPQPGESPMEFFRAYMACQDEYNKVKRLVKPESSDVFPVFNVPEGWFQPHKPDQPSGETSQAAKGQQVEDEQPKKDNVEAGEALSSAQCHQAITQEDIQVTTEENVPASIDASTQVTIRENDQATANANAQATTQVTTDQNTQATPDQTTQATTEGSDGTPSQANISHRRSRSTLSRHTGNELASATNSALVVREQRHSSRNSVTFADGSNQVVTYQTGESSNQSNETQMTPENLELVKSIVKEQLDKRITDEEVQAYINRVTNAKVEDFKTRTAQAAIDKDAHEKLAQTQKLLAQKEKELAEQKKLVKEQRQQLTQYQATSTPPKGTSTPTRGNTSGRKQRSGQKMKPALPKYGESGYSYLKPNPQANLPPRPNWTTSQQVAFEHGASRFQNQHQTITGPQMGFPAGTPSRQQMGPPMGYQMGQPVHGQAMGPLQITPPHMIPQMGHPQFTPPHAPQMGYPHMAPMHTVPQHIPPQMGLMQNNAPYMAPQMGPYNAPFAGYGNHGMSNPTLVQPMTLPTRQPGGPLMGQGQMMAPQHMDPQNMPPPNMMPPSNTMGHQHMGHPHPMAPQYQQVMANAPQQAMAAPQMLAPPNVGRPQPARATSQEARLIEQGNISNDHCNEDFGNRQMGQLMAPQGNHGFGNRQMGPQMAPPQPGPWPHETGDVRNMDQGNRGFGHRQHQKCGSEEMQPPNNDPSFLDLEENPVAGNPTQLNYGIDPPQIAARKQAERDHEMRVRREAQMQRQMIAEMHGQVNTQTHDDMIALRDDERRAEMDDRMNAQMEVTPSSRRGNRRMGNDQMMAASPFNHHNVSPPYAAGFGRASRSPQEERTAQRGNEVEDPFSGTENIRVSSIHRGQAQLRDFGAVGTRRLPPPALGDFKFPDNSRTRLSGHPGLREEPFNSPYHDEDEARAAEMGILPSPRLF